MHLGIWAIGSLRPVVKTIDKTHRGMQLREFVTTLQRNPGYRSKFEPGFFVCTTRAHRSAEGYPAMRATRATQMGTLRLSVPCGDSASTTVPTPAPAILAIAIVAGLLSSA